MSEFLLLSRGQWDADRSPEQIQGAIDEFYGWFDEQAAAGVFKGVRARPVVKKAIRLSAAKSAMAWRVGMVALAMCGVSTTLGTLSKSGCTEGSPSNTSIPAAAIWRAAKA